MIIIISTININSITSIIYITIMSQVPVILVSIASTKNNNYDINKSQKANKREKNM